MADLKRWAKMKLGLFILCYGAPTALAFILFDIADRGSALRAFGLLITGLLLGLMASIGLHFFDIGPTHASFMKQKMSALALRGGIAGVLFVGLSLLSLQLGGFRFGFYSAMTLSIVIAPLALLVPPRSSGR